MTDFLTREWIIHPRGLRCIFFIFSFPPCAIFDTAAYGIAGWPAVHFRCSDHSALDRITSPAYNTRAMKDSRVIQFRAVNNAYTADASTRDDCDNDPAVNARDGLYANIINALLDGTRPTINYETSSL